MDSAAVLSTLLTTSSEREREAAWEALVASHSRLILHVARAIGPDPDSVMDRYAYVLEQLRGDDFRRLRTFAADGRSRFSTWLVVVARRLCFDHARHRHGRIRKAADPDSHEAQVQLARKRLERLFAADIELEDLPASEPSADALEMLCESELTESVQAALASLGSEDRLLIALRFEDGHSAAEIARILGLPTPFHVYRRLNKVLESLRLALSARGISQVPEPR